MKAVLTLVMLVALSVVGMAQGGRGFVAGGLQIKSGSFSLYDIPNSEVGSAKAVGAFGEFGYDVVTGKFVVAPRVLASIERNYPKGGGDFNQFDLRPEVEVRAKVGHGYQAVLAGGFNYTEGAQGSTQINPILGAGIQYYGVRGSVYRFFPDGDQGNARGILYRVDYTKNLSPVGIRISGEIFSGRSELKYAPLHPGYEGVTYTLRIGVIK